MTDTRTGLAPGRIFAYAGILLGLGISTTINVMHAVRTSGQWWSPWLDGAWPVLLFIALEVLTRTRWGAGSARYAAWFGVGVVALVAGVESYWNLRAMMILAHKEVWLATLGPLGIDGLMVACAAALLAHDEPAQDVALVTAEPAHESRPGPLGQPTGPVHATGLGQPTGPAQSVDTQVTASKAASAPVKAAVSQKALDVVLAAVRSGQPMTKGEIVKTTPLSRSTVTRAVDHLIQMGQLTALGDPAQPSYVLARLNQEVTR